MNHLSHTTHNYETSPHSTYGGMHVVLPILATNLVWVMTTQTLTNKTITRNTSKHYITPSQLYISGGVVTFSAIMRNRQVLSGGSYDETVVVSLLMWRKHGTMRLHT